LRLLLILEIAKADQTMSLNLSGRTGQCWAIAPLSIAKTLREMGKASEIFLPSIANCSVGRCS
jgi:hypothetical protein